MNIRASFAVVLVVLLTIGPALLAGRYLNRWGTTAEAENAARQIAKLPTEFGRWKVVREGEPLAESVQSELGIFGYVSRIYENRDNGSKITLLLMVGQPGPLLRHPPNICYANRANRQIGDITKFGTDKTTPNSEFTAIEYQPPGAVESDRFVVAYAMTTGTTWSVPRYPRLEFGAASTLYKVQILSSLGSAQERPKNLEMLKEFAGDFTAAFSQLQGNSMPKANN